MKTKNRLALIAAAWLATAFSTSAMADNAPASTTCKDGTTSTATGRGACSGHGGVQKAPKSASTVSSNPAATASASPSAPAAPAATQTQSPPAASAGSGAKSAPTATAGNTNPAGASAKCKDGTYSKSQHRSGTCSSHGGVAEWLTAH